MFPSTSPSARAAASQAEGSSHHRPCGKRTSTSFDDNTLGELAGGAARIQEAHATISKKKKKAGFWRSRLWNLSRGRRASQEMRPAIYEKEDSMPGKWTKLLHRLKSRGKDQPVLAVRASSLDLRLNHPNVMASFRGQVPSKSITAEEKQQRFYPVFPERTPAGQRETVIPIWERRNSASPPKLDLRTLGVTGVRHLPRPQQARG